MWVAKHSAYIAVVKTVKMITLRDGKTVKTNLRIQYKQTQEHSSQGNT